MQTVAPMTAPIRPVSSVSNRSASSSVGTTSTGSRAIAARKPSITRPVRPELGGPTMSERVIASNLMARHGNGRMGITRGNSGVRFAVGGRL